MLLRDWQIESPQFQHTNADHIMPWGPYLSLSFQQLAKKFLLVKPIVKRIPSRDF